MKSWYRLIPHSKARGPNNASRGAYLVRLGSAPPVPRLFSGGCERETCHRRS